ncbi:MAG: DNA-binding response regulator, partial [Bacteroidota bacterium]
MKAIIIDDEIGARNDLKHLLQSHRDEVDLVGEADNIFDGQTLIHAIQPSLIFLDIDISPHT